MLNEDLLNAIDILLSASADFVFCGSLSLKIHGVLERRIKDIDVVIYKDIPLENYGFGKMLPPKDSLEKPRIMRDESGHEMPVISMKINNISVDLFMVEKINYSNINFFGREIKVQNVEDTLSAKRAWAKFSVNNSEKHNKDLRVIKSIS